MPDRSSVAINRTLLRELRQMKGYSVRAFAAACGVSDAYISRLETGVRTHVSPPVFARICDALSIAPGERRRLVAPKRDRVAA